MNHHAVSRNGLSASRLFFANWKLLFLAFLLLAEVVLTTLCFDGKTLELPDLSDPHRAIPSLDDAAEGANHREHRSSIFTYIVSHANLFLRAAIVALSTLILLRGRKLSAALAELPVPPVGSYIIPALLSHILIFLAFLGITYAVFETDALGSSYRTLAFCAWIIFGLLVVLSLTVSVVPYRQFFRLLREFSPSLLLSTAVGITATFASDMAARSWSSLASLTLDCVYWLLQVLEREVIYRPSDFIVGTERFTVEIAPACSGYEGIGLVFIFLSVYLIAFRKQYRFPRVLVLFPVGAVLIWLVNIVRIVALIEVGTRISRDVAAGGFHSQAGWIGFNAVALGLVLISRSLHWFRPETEFETSAATVREGPSREVVYLAPFMAIIATSMISSAFSTSRFDAFYPVRLVAVAIPLWVYRQEYAALKWSVSWRAVPLGILVYLVWISQSLLASGSLAPAEPYPENFSTGWSSLWIMSRIVGSTLTVPLAEELAFRGFLTRRLISSDFDTVPPGQMTWFSMVASSVAFGLLHPHWVEGIIAGMLYAFAYRRGSIGDAVVAHGVTNGILSAQCLVQGDWSIIS